MWLYHQNRLINLDQCRAIEYCYEELAIFADYQHDFFRLFDGTKEQCEKYLNLLAMHMSTNPTVINHDDIIKGLGVE